MAERDTAVAARLAEVAREHRLSEGAVDALWDALLRGGGRMAQFSHPDLGGMGQWSGGLLQIGDMFNASLKGRVAAVFADLSRLAAAEPADRAPSSPSPMAAWDAVDWWPGDLGRPAASGAQNGSHYAYFPERRRLAIARDGRVTLYDTGHHRILGLSQQQSRGQHLAFTGEDGTVDIDSLRVVEG